jgi:hypothetical protein
MQVRACRQAWQDCDIRGADHCAERFCVHALQGARQALELPLQRWRRWRPPLARRSWRSRSWWWWRRWGTRSKRPSAWCRRREPRRRERRIRRSAAAHGGGQRGDRGRGRGGGVQRGRLARSVTWQEPIEELSERFAARKATVDVHTKETRTRRHAAGAAAASRRTWTTSFSSSTRRTPT